jgi:hypothetical protein
MTGSQAHECTECGAACLPIAYGMPGPELIADYEAGRVALGGCVIGDVIPSWRCPDCGREE